MSSAALGEHGLSTASDGGYGIGAAMRHVPSLLNLATETCITAEVSELGEAVSHAVRRQGAARQRLDKARRALNAEVACHSSGPSTRAMARARARQLEKRSVAQRARSPSRPSWKPCSFTDLQAASAEAKRADKALTRARESARKAWEAAGVKFIGWPTEEQAEKLENFAASFGRVGLGLDQSMRWFCKPCHYQERSHVPQPGCPPPNHEPPRLLRHIPCPLCSWELGVGYTRTEDFICQASHDGSGSPRGGRRSLQHERLGLVCLNPLCIARLTVFQPHRNVKLRMCCADETSYLEQSQWDVDPAARWVHRRPAHLHDTEAHEIHEKALLEEERIYTTNDTESDCGSDSEREDFCQKGFLHVQRAQRESHRGWRASLLMSDPLPEASSGPSSAPGRTRTRAAAAAAAGSRGSKGSRRRKAPAARLPSTLDEAPKKKIKKKHQQPQPPFPPTVPGPEMWIRRDRWGYCPSVFVVPSDDHNAYACSRCRNKTWDAHKYRHKNIVRCSQCITCVRMLETELPCRVPAGRGRRKGKPCGGGGLVVDEYNGPESWSDAEGSRRGESWANKDETEIGIDICGGCGKPVCHMCESDSSDDSEEDDWGFDDDDDYDDEEDDEDRPEEATAGAA